jgi:hypothetical protein
MDEDLVRSGRYAKLEIDPDKPGPVVTVGFFEEPDGSLLVAAARPDSGWARQLLASPVVRVTVAERAVLMTAVAVGDHDPDRNRAIRELILRYGTPSERLGHGPVFRLVPRPEG